MNEQRDLWAGLAEAGLSPETLARLEGMYMMSFPEEERRPWEQILSGRDDRFAVRLLQHAGEVCGFVTIWRLSSAVFVEHLVVAGHLRGQGVGSRAVARLLGEADMRPLVLEIEPRELSPEAERRQIFYERLGLSLLPIAYIQPLYTAGGAGIRLRLMSSRPLKAKEMQTIVDELHREVYEQTTIHYASI